MITPDTIVPLPDNGRLIRYRKRGKSTWSQGIVQCVWRYDEAIIDVPGACIIPAFGDKWEYVEAL